MENIMLFISNKYIEFVEYIQDFIKSGNFIFHILQIQLIKMIFNSYFIGDKIQTDSTLFRQNIISFMAIKFPIKGIFNITI